MNWKSLSRRCARLDMSPVSRLSRPMTLCPRASKVSQRCEPMKPAAPVTTVVGMNGLVRDAAIEKAANDRQPHDLDVEADRPVFDVVQVVLDALLERRVPAPPVHLRPASDACFH